MKKIIVIGCLFALFAVTMAKPEILNVLSCDKQVCKVDFLGKKYEINVLNKTKNALMFPYYQENEIKHDQKFARTLIVYSAESNSLALDNGHLFVNFETLVKTEGKEQQKKYLQKNVVGKQVTIYYNELKNGVIATGDVYIDYSGQNLVSLLNSMKQTFENYGKQLIEKANYLIKENSEKFSVLSLDAGFLQIDYTIVGKSKSSCVVDLYKDGGKKYINLIDIKSGSSVKASKKVTIVAGNYYVQASAINATCGIVLKQIKQ